LIKGVGRKISRGRGQRKKRPKNRKTPKHSTIKPLPWGPMVSKTEKIAKHGKIALFSLIYYISTMYENPGERALPPCRRPWR